MQQGGLQPSPKEDLSESESEGQEEEDVEATGTEECTGKSTAKGEGQQHKASKEGRELKAEKGDTARETWLREDGSSQDRDASSPDQQPQVDEMGLALARYRHRVWSAREAFVSKTRRKSAEHDRRWGEAVDQTDRYLRERRRQKSVLAREKENPPGVRQAGTDAKEARNEHHALQVTTLARDVEQYIARMQKLRIMQNENARKLNNQSAI